MDSNIDFWELNKELTVTIIAIAIIILSAFVFIKILKKIFSKYRVDADNDIRKEKKTLMRMLYSVLRFIVWIIAIMAILSCAGVDITGAVAGLGIAGAIGGLAVQDLLKDLIQGINLVSDRYFAIGDIIEYNKEPVKVVEMSMRSVKVKSILDGSIITIGNRFLTEARKVSGLVALKIPLSYEADMKYVYKVLGETAKKIEEIPEITKCDFKGTQEFADSAIIYLIVIWCQPEEYPEVRRKALRIIQESLCEANLEIPYNQIDVHMQQVKENINS